MMKEIDVKHACSFTGHRPERLNQYSEEEVVNWLDQQIDAAIENGYTDFISGMQRGVDIWAAEIVLKKKNEHENIRLFAACAFPGMERQWESSWIERYNDIFKLADDHVFVRNNPGRAAFYARNEWMVDHSSRVIAVYTGAPGGTLKTIKYAESNGRDVIQICKKD